MLSSCDFSTKLEGIAKLAQNAPDMSFTSLSHHLNLEMLGEAYRRTRKDGAPGVDGQTALDYERSLESNLQSLLNRVKSGIYRAPPVRRVHIPKGKGSETRGIGIPTFEDKVLQRAVYMILEAIYEQDFLECSYGFRPGRSAHQMLESVWQQLMNIKGGFVIEIDIRKFFDALDHERLREVLSRRMRDGVLSRLIGKWLRAGVMENGQVSYSNAGTPQGGVISPLLANIFLHEVIDSWFEDIVKPCLKGQANLYRFADDIIIVLNDERDSERLMTALCNRLAKYGLSYHPDKTRVIHFVPGKRDGCFNLLGFTHFWGKSRRGKWVLKRKTSNNRFSAGLKRIGTWCQLNRHQKVIEQHKILSSKLQGHYSYFGITGNYGGLSRFHYECERLWKKWLERRSRKARMNFEQFREFLKRLSLPKPIVVHSVLRNVANI